MYPFSPGPAIEPRVAEIPSAERDLSDRARWLRRIMLDRWSRLDPSLRAWREAMIDCVVNFDADCVVFCHFVAINVIVGAATGSDDVITFRPDNGSVTTILAENGTLGLIALGREADTRVA